MSSEFLSPRLFTAGIRITELGDFKKILNMRKKYCIKSDLCVIYVYKVFLDSSVGRASGC